MNHYEDYESVVLKLGELASDCGAFKSTVIPEASVAASAEFRKICESNKCGAYNRCWMCPPDCGEITELMEKLKAYEHVFLYQSVSELEDSFDFEGMVEAKRDHAQMSQNINCRLPELLPAGFLHLSVGGCNLCEECGKKTGIPCRHPDKALASLEGYGIDVYQTVKPTELKYINGKDTVTYFGAVFF